MHGSAPVYTVPESKTAGRSIINEKNINGFGTFHGSQRKLLCGRCVPGRFATEERTADALVDALTGSTGYEQVSKSFSQGLKEKLNAAAFTKVKEEIRKQVGAIKNVNFVVLNKQYDLQKGYNGIDELVYFGTVSKEKFARIFVSFAEENGKPMVTGFQVTPIEPAKQQAKEKK